MNNNNEKTIQYTAFAKKKATINVIDKLFTSIATINHKRNNIIKKKYPPKK